MSFSIWNLFQLKKFYNDFPFFDRSSSYCKQIVRTEPAILPNHRTEFDLDGRKKLHLRERAENVDLLLMSACLKVSKSQKYFFLETLLFKKRTKLRQNSALWRSYEARAEFLSDILSFGQWRFKKICFCDLLTFIKITLSLFNFQV